MNVSEREPDGIGSGDGFCGENGRHTLTGEFPWQRLNRQDKVPAPLRRIRSGGFYAWPPYSGLAGKAH